jgi:hypothetical protein
MDTHILLFAAAFDFLKHLDNRKKKLFFVVLNQFECIDSYNSPRNF